MNADFWLYYGIATATVILYAAILVGFAKQSEKKWGARVILLSPLWPVLAFFGIGIAVAKLWDLADWRKK